MNRERGGIGITHVSLSFSVTFLCLFSLVSEVAAEEVPVWNSQWKHHQKVVVQETAGISRAREPVNIEIQFWQPLRDGVFADVKREIRVIHYSIDEGYKEIPSQVYDIRPGRRNEKKDPPEVFVRARVAFFADVNAYATKRYFVYFGNPSAEPPRYHTDLSVKGEGVHYTVENKFYKIMTEEKSGQIDQIDLKFATKPSWRFEYGPVHWNPDFIVAPEDFPLTNYTWYYAHHFDNPDREVESGPILFSMKRRQLIPGQDTVYMEVYYRFYAGLPYYIMESYMEAKKDARTFAVRNDELGISGVSFTHAGWRNKTPDMLEHHMGAIGTRSYTNSDLTSGLGSALPPNMAWVSMGQLDEGYAFGSIRLMWKNINVLNGEQSPLYNSHTVIRRHTNDFHYFRSLIYSPRLSAGLTTEEANSFLIDVPKGSSYQEKNAYMFYEFDREKQFEPLDNTYFQLRTPLKVKVLRGD